MKNLISTLILGGSLIIGGCGNKSKEVNDLKKTQLEDIEALSENKYLNFVEFVAENGEYFEEKTKQNQLKKGHKINIKEKNISCQVVRVSKANAQGTVMRFGRCAIEDYKSDGFKKEVDIHKDKEHPILRNSDGYWIGEMYFSANELSQNKFNKVKNIYDSLITNIPKWYEESKGVEKK